MSSESDKVRRQWVGLGALALIIVAGITIVVVTRGGDDNEATVKEEKRLALCALRDSESEPLVDPQSSSTRDELADKVRDRAAALTSAAEATDGDVSAALTTSADALNKVAEAIAADTTGKSLSEVVAALAADEEFVASSATLQQVLTAQCS